MGTEYAHPVSREVLDEVAAALTENGFLAEVADDGPDAKRRALEKIPKGAEVYTAQSATLNALGIAEAIDESGEYDSVRKRLASMDRATQADEMRALGARPQYIIGSPQAITRDGQVVMASYGGSQLAGYVSGARHVVWVVGAQKIVTNVDEAFDRIDNHALPLESARLEAAIGVPSRANNLLLIRAAVRPRFNVVLVPEALGF
ncbi:MAG: LUD domain-containing protein [Candidatus Dormiibacterota bacterium]